MLIEPDSGLVARLCASPNHGARAGGKAPDSIILHYTGMADGPSALAWLCNPRSSVSCHYLVEEDGAVVQLVAERRRAWHAGRSSWRGVEDMNSASLGIEIVNGGHDGGLPPFPERQIRAIIELCRDLGSRHAIAPERILAHSDIAPGRKQDPGERFPWSELFRAGIGHWVPERSAHGAVLKPGDQGAGVAALQAALARYGYGIDRTGHFDEATRVVVAAFQRHFRQSRVDGIADPGTVATLDDLLGALPLHQGDPLRAASKRLPTRA